MSHGGSSREISDPRLVGDPLVSVIVLVYNHEIYLADTLESVLTQGVDFPFEVLIGEDCSTDGSMNIALHYLAAYPGSVRIITADRNVGAFENARRLLQATRGRFIASLDGDDHWLPGKLGRQVSFLWENPDCVAVYTNAIAIDERGHEIGLFNDVGTDCFDLAAILRRGNFLNSSSLMYRAEIKPVLRELGDNLLDYRVHLSIARYGLLGHFGDPLVVYRVNSSGSMVANYNARVRELYWQAIQSVPRDLVTDDDYAHGLADFLRRVFFRAVRTRRIALWREWRPRVFAASPYGTARMYWLTAANILRMLAREALGRFRRDADGNRLRVLYRR